MGAITNQPCKRQEAMNETHFPISVPLLLLNDQVGGQAEMGPLGVELSP
jgi:hypothetical protein